MNAKDLRDLANRWAEEYVAAGMPHPMPLSMYPDAWLRAQADRIEPKPTTSRGNPILREFKRFCVEEWDIRPGHLGAYADAWVELIDADPTLEDPSNWGDMRGCATPSEVARARRVLERLASLDGVS